MLEIDGVMVAFLIACGHKDVGGIVAKTMYGGYFTHKTESP